MVKRIAVIGGGYVGGALPVEESLIPLEVEYSQLRDEVLVQP